LDKTEHNRLAQSQRRSNLDYACLVLSAKQIRLVALTVKLNLRLRYSSSDKVGLQPAVVEVQRILGILKSACWFLAHSSWSFVRPTRAREGVRLWHQKRVYDTRRTGLAL